jgi:uncharacterized protein
MTPEEALRILEEEHTPENVVEHCKAVAKKAVRMAEKIRAAGHKIDVNLVETGALLHDIGRSQAHGANHGHIGGLILRSRGLKEHALIAERHIGAGIARDEAKKLGLPAKDYIPQTLEEKVVADADNLIEETHSIPIWNTVQKFRDEGVPEAAVNRLTELYQEIEALMASS